ncbi:phage gp6-like head-tail connector protein [Andreesenia angusta]|uniref:Phage gp6-like head-tail connector protein n=1 Tax=Andreesenia angusta TaxID=39480 RepID=A0A1S1V6P2_9FIRM|nr:phage head-tail connector protein [Andreesenia angusta]OHW62174.1 phage gp6-like head-tail connector protein [Andreesenia angusta]
MINKIKTLLNITDSSQDELLSLYLDIVKQKVLNYCNREDIPSGLELIIVEITADEFRAKTRKNAIESGEETGAVSSIKRGGMQINYESSSSESNYNKLTGGGAEFIANYQIQLDRFKVTKEKRVRFI